MWGVRDLHKCVQLAPQHRQHAREPGAQKALPQRFPRWPSQACYSEDSFKDLGKVAEQHLLPATAVKKCALRVLRVGSRLEALQASAWRLEGFETGRDQDEVWQFKLRSS